MATGEPSPHPVQGARISAVKVSVREGAWGLRIADADRVRNLPISAVKVIRSA